MRWPAVLAALLALALAAGARPAFGPDPRTVVVRLEGLTPVVGPSLAGTNVLWIAHEGREVFTVRRRAPRRLWRAPRVADPRGIETTLGWDRRIVQRVDALAASGERAAFIHTASLVAEPACARATPPCLGLPAQVVPFAGEVWVGPPRGPFRRIAHAAAAMCSGRRLATSLDVSGRVVVYADAKACLRADEAPQDRIVLDSPRGRRVVATLGAGMRVESVRVAWPYVAWVALRSGAAPSLVVRDLRTGRVPYRIELPSRSTPALDVDATGRVAVLLERVGRCAAAFDVATADLRAPRLRVLAVRAAVPAVRLAAGKLAVARADGCRADQVEPVVVRLGGRTTAPGVPAGWALGGFDLDARRIAYAATTSFPVRDPRLRRRTNIYVVRLRG